MKLFVHRLQKILDFRTRYFVDILFDVEMIFILVAEVGEQKLQCVPHNHLRDVESGQVRGQRLQTDTCFAIASVASCEGHVVERGVRVHELEEEDLQYHIILVL